MLWFDRLYLQDTVEVRRESVPETKRLLKAKANIIVPWNYEQTRQVCEKSLNGGIRLDQAVSAATAIRNKIGKDSNEEAIKLLHPHFSKIRGNYYPLGNDRFRYGPALYCQVKALGHVFYENTGTIYWLQLRKTVVLSENELSFIGAVLRITFIDLPDFENFAVKILDIGAASRQERVLREYDIVALPSRSNAEVEEFFAPVHQAVLELRQEGFEPKRTERTRDVGPDEQFKLDLK